MAPFESTDHGFISSSDDIEEGTTNQFFTQARAQASFQVSNRPINLLGDQVFDGVTYLFGGLDLTDGIITYIPPTPVPDSPSFNTLTLGNGGANLGVINLKDTTNIGIDTVAQMKGILESNNGGQLEFHTKLNGGSLTKRMAIKNNGATEIYSDGIGLSILSSDGALQQAQIYHGSTGTQDLIIDTDAPATTTKGISFRTQAGVQRLRIGYFGELGFSSTNDIGLSGQILESRGEGNTPHWVNPTASPTNLVETYIKSKTLSGTGATDFFTIDRDIQRSFVVDLRIVGGDGINICTLYHTRTGIVFTGSEIFIKNNEIIANTSFSGGGSAYTTSIIEAPSNVQLDIRVNSATGGTQTVAAYMTLYGTRTNPTVVIS